MKHIRSNGSIIGALNNTYGNSGVFDLDLGGLVPDVVEPVFQTNVNGQLTVTVPSGYTNSLGILTMTTRDYDGPATFSVPSGWTLIGQGGDTGEEWTAFAYKWLTATDVGTNIGLMVSGSTTNTTLLIFSASGSIVAGSAFGAGGGAAASVNVPSATSPYSLIVASVTSNNINPSFTSTHPLNNYLVSLGTDDGRFGYSIFGTTRGSFNVSGLDNGADNLVGAAWLEFS